MRYQKILAVIGFILASTPALAANRIEVNYGEIQTITSGATGLKYFGPNGGGVIANYSGTVIIEDNLKFSLNQADAGGAIYSVPDSTVGHPPATLTVGNGVLFLQNTAVADAGGAIYVSGNAAPSILAILNNVSFIGNTAPLGWGGALYLQDVTTNIGDGAIFDSNMSGIHGGAIFNWNFASTTGAATIGNNASFTNNSAKTNGGAIANYVSDITIGSGATFSGNTAGGQGGAIYNTGTITFDGNVTFANNTAAGVLNDIYSLGDVSFTGSGTVTLDGGVIGGTGSSITFDPNTTLIAKLQMTPTIMADTITIGSGSTLSNLVIGTGVSGNNLELWDIANATGSFAYTGINALYNITQNADDTFNVSQKTADQIAANTGANSNQVSALMGLISGPSSNSQFNTIANNITDLMQSGNPAEVAEALAAAEAFAPTSAPSAQAIATQNSLQVLDAIGTRLSGGIPTASGQSSGDLRLRREAIWVQGLINGSRLRGNNGFSSDSRGAAAGAEALVSESVKLGVGYAYTNTHVTPTISESKINSHTALLYGEYKPTAWFVNGAASYTWSNYDDEKHILGSTVTSEHTINTFAAQGITGYELSDHDVMLTPQAGLRYLNVSQESFTDSTGSSTHSGNFNYLTGIAGVKLAYEYKRQSHEYGGASKCSLRPEIYAGAIYDIITDDVSAYMTMANGAVINVRGSALERFGMEAGAGLTMAIDRVDLTVSYIGRFRSNYTDNTGLVTLKYRF